VPNSIEAWQDFRDAWSKSVIFGKASPDAALAGAAAQINKLVAANPTP
jgi:multiple sugar transport system substrate-binding protein